MESERELGKCEWDFSVLSRRRKEGEGDEREREVKGKGGNGEEGLTTLLFEQN